MAVPDLRIVQGDWIACSEWLDFPNLVEAPSPTGPRQSCQYRVAKEDAVKAARAARRTPVFDFWSMVVGVPPRVMGSAPNDGDLTSLSLAHACFKGLQRPVASDNAGENILVYVLKPKFHYVFAPRMTCCADKQIVPDDLVFVVYAKLDEPFNEFTHSVKGILTHWQFVEADSNDPSLPVDYEGRYGRQLW